MLEKSKITTLRQAQEFILFFAYSITEESVDDSMPYVEMTVSDFGNILEEFHVITPSLNREYQSQFGCEKVAIWYTSGLLSEQMALLLKDNNVDVENDDDMDQYLAIFYAAIYLADPAFRDTIWQIIDKFGEIECNINELNLAYITCESGPFGK